LTAAAIAGGQTAAAKPKVPKAPAIAGGALSMMDETNTILRARLRVSPIPLVRDLAYTAAPLCSYSQIYMAPNAPPREALLTMVSRPARGDRLLITAQQGPDVGTVLIGRTGKLFDFNLKDISTGLRSNSETLQTLAAAQKNRLRPTHGPTLETINEVTAIFPEYIPGRRQVGEVVAVVTTTDNRPWATYVFRGVGTFAGSGVAVLDLVRTYNSAPQMGPVTIGFQVVELATMMPVLFVLDSGWKLRLQRLTCP